MKTRIAKIFAVVLALVLIVGVFSTFVSATTNPLDITNEEAGIQTFAKETEFAGINNSKNANIAEFGRNVISGSNKLVHEFATKTSNGNSYLNLFRTVERNGNRYGDTYLDLDLTGDNKHTYGAGEYTLDKYDYITLDFDITADKWVSQDANGKWNILTDNFVAGARASYSSNVQMNTFTARYYAPGASSPTWATGTNKTVATLNMKNEYGTWRVYSRANEWGKNTKGVIAGTGVGTWSHMTIIVDISMLTFVGYNSADQVTEVDSEIAYYLCPNIAEAKIYVYFNGQPVAVTMGTHTIDGTDNHKNVAYGKVFPDMTATTKIAAKVVDGVAHPHIATDVSRFTFLSGVNNEAYSMCIDNYATTFYEDGYEGALSELALGSATNLNTLNDVVYNANYQKPAAPGTVANIETYKVMTGQAIDDGNYVGKSGGVLSYGYFTPVRYTDGGVTRAAITVVDLDPAGTSAKNGYVRVYRDLNIHGSMPQGATNFYNDVKNFGSYANTSTSFAKYDYITADFDITADQWLLADGKTLSATYEEGATPAYPVGVEFNLFYRQKKDASNTPNNMGALYLRIDKRDDGFYLVNKVNTDAVKLPNYAGAWTHITYVADFSEVTFTEFATNKFTSDINTKGKLHIYVNGELYTTLTGSQYFSAAVSEANYIAGSGGLPIIGFDCLRIQSPSGSDAENAPMNTRSFSYGIDNIIVQHHKADNFAAQHADPKTPLYTNPNAVYTMDYNYINGYAAAIEKTYDTSNSITVTKKIGYANFEWAYEAATENDTLILGRDSDATFEIDKPVKVNTNGKNFLWYSTGYFGLEDELPDDFEAYYLDEDGKFRLVSYAENPELFGEVYWNNPNGVDYLYAFYGLGSTPVYEGPTYDDVTMEGNEWFVLAFGGYEQFTLTEDNAYADVYAITEVKADVNVLFNMRTTTSFTSYFYVPWIDNDNAPKFTVGEDEYVLTNIRVYDGAVIDEAQNLATKTNSEGKNPGYRLQSETLEGYPYKKVGASPGANENRSHVYTVAIDVNGETYSKTYRISLENYFTTILEGDYDDATKSLIIHAVNYMNATNSAAKQPTAPAAFSHIVEKYSNYLITNGTENTEAFEALIEAEAAKADISGLSSLKDASFAIDVANNPGYRPTFIFGLADGIEYEEGKAPFRVSVYFDLFKNGTPEKGSSIGFEKNYFYIPDYFGVYYYSTPMEIRVGEETGTYGLAAYIVETELEGATAVSEVARALYAYAIASYNYKCGNTAMYTFAAE